MAPKNKLKKKKSRYLLAVDQLYIPDELGGVLQGIQDLIDGSSQMKFNVIVPKTSLGHHFKLQIPVGHAEYV